MYLAETSQADTEALVAQTAKKLGLDPSEAIKKYREVRLAMAKAPNKAAYLRASLESAKKEHKKALETLAELREKAKKVKDNAKRVEVLDTINKEEARLRRVGSLLSQGKAGLGFAWAALPWFSIIMGLTMAGVTVAGFLSFKKEVQKVADNTASAIITMTYVTAIGGGLLMLLYMGKLFREAYGGGPDSGKRARA